MPQIPLPIRLVVALLLTLAPVDGAKKTAVTEGCWSDGRKDIMVLTEECPPPMPPLDEMTLWLSWYDPALCYDADGNVIENINCDASPETMAGGTAVSPEMYGYAAACLPGWFDQVVVIELIGQRHCLDTGGDVVPTYREIYHPRQGFITLWIIPIDVLAHHTNPPWWQYLPVEADDWEVLP